MSALMVALAARDALTDDQREALRHVGEAVSLGESAIYVDEGGTEWAIYDDARFTLADAARGACIMANAASFPDFDPKDRSRAGIHAEDVRFAQERGVVLPDAVPHAEGGDRWAEVLAANNAPAAMKMGSVPATWRPAATDGGGI